MICFSEVTIIALYETKAKVGFMPKIHIPHHGLCEDLFFMSLIICKSKVC